MIDHNTYNQPKLVSTPNSLPPPFNPAVYLLKDGVLYVCVCVYYNLKGWKVKMGNSFQSMLLVLTYYTWGSSWIIFLISN